MCEPSQEQRSVSDIVYSERGGFASRPRRDLVIAEPAMISPPFPFDLIGAMTNDKSVLESRSAFAVL